MGMRNILGKVVSRALLPNLQLAYAQAGEDLILARLFYKENILKPSYLDIGANHPSYLSNTYYFYVRGSRGVCIEPNPVLFRKFKKVRTSDTVLNVGVGIGEEKEADFYLFSGRFDGLSTFSKEQAYYWKNVGMDKVGKIDFDRIIRVPLLRVNDILQRYCAMLPDFISIDVEGLDLEILKSIDFNTYRPLAFCVETLGYDANQKEYKRTEIEDFLVNKDYKVYAETSINTIFIRN